MLRDRIIHHVLLRAASISISISWTAACGLQVAPVVEPDTDTDATTTGLASGDSTAADSTADETGSGGPVPPMADCEVDPIDLAAPRWEWNAGPDAPSTPFERYSVLPGGDVLWREGHVRVGRWTAGGEPVWELDAAAGEVWSHVAATAFGEPIVVGHVGDAMGDPAQLQLLRLSAAGERLDERLYDDAPGAGQVPTSLGVAATGDVFVEVFWLDDERWRLQRYDASLERAWSLELEPERSYFSLTVDDDANVYMASLMGSTAAGWTARLDAYDVDGELRWSEGFDLPVVQPSGTLSVGDGVYLLAGGLDSPSLLMGWDLAGNFVFTSSSDDSDPFRIANAMAASPCGGVYVGGRAAVEGLGTRAALWHVDANGVEGPVSALVEAAPLEGWEYESVDRVELSPLDELVVRGQLGSSLGGGEPATEWMRGY